MALAAEKIEADLELKSSAEKFFKLLSKELHHVPKASSDKIHQVDVHEGDWKTSGSVKLWTYTIDGKEETLKEKMEVDEANMVWTLTAVDGHVLEQYKTYKLTITTTPKTEGCLVKITLDFEKLNPNVPPPTKYLDFLVAIVKDIDAHLGKD